MTAQKSPKPNLALMGCLGFVGISMLILAGMTALLIYQERQPNRPLPTDTTQPTASLPPVASASFPAPTGSPLSSPTAAPTFTALASPTATLPPSQTPTATSTFPPTWTFTFTPSPTHTRWPTATRTKTPLVTATNVPTAINDYAYNFTYSSWRGISNNRALGGGMRCSGQQDEFLIYHVDRSVEELGVIFFTGPNHGMADIYLDNVFKETVDLYSDTPKSGFDIIYDNLDLNQTSHELKIVVRREKRAESTGYQVCVDAFRLERARVDDANPNIQYGDWLGQHNNNALEETYRIASVANATLTFDLNGASFTWVTTTCPSCGQADIYVDGKFLTNVDLYSANYRWRVNLLIRGAGPGKHEIKIIVLGQHNSASTGYDVMFDAILLP
jgi:hypothetical protein